MEVHAHSHTERKKFTHYLWEFLMLFLAVFCGFLAENFREQQVEHRLEKEYLKDLVQNLAADTVMINGSLRFAKNIVQGLDSLKQNLYSENVLKNTVLIYRQAFTYCRLVNPRFNDQTITQLRNSGNLRLVKKKEITDKISTYWNAIVTTTMISEKIADHVDFSQQAAYKIFNGKYVKDLDSITDTGFKLYSIDPTAQFLTNDKITLVAYANSLNRLAATISSFYINNMLNDKSQAIELIQLIQKEYYLKN